MTGLKKFSNILGNKKKLLLLVVLLLVAGVSAFVANKMFFQEEPKEKEATSYQIEEDSIPMISSVIGERKLDKMVKQQTAGIQKIEYQYKSIETAAEDVKAYTEYLLNDLGFSPLFKFYLDNPAGYISVARPSVKEGYLFQVDIDYTPDEFNIILSCPQKEMPVVYEEEKTDKSFTRDAAKSFLAQQPLEKLGLTEPLSSYTTIFDQGRLVIDGKDCYGMSVYKKGNGQSNEIVGKYFVSLDKSRIYQYDIYDSSYRIIYEDIISGAGQSLTDDQKARMAIIQESFKTAVGQGLNLMFP
jgi:hypothetical protein